MKTRNVDVAIIGAGSAGMNARREVEKAGFEPLMIESGHYGTTCARVGCMPSKLLIAASDIAHEIKSAPLFGIESGDGVKINGTAVLERVRRERDRFVSFVVEDIEALPYQQRLLGSARFTGPTSLMVGEHTELKANSIVIATGSSPVIPPPFNTLQEHVLVNDDIFELEDIPKSIAVIGTGIIGLELGQALNRLGADVTLFNPGNSVGPLSDPEVEKVAREILQAELSIQLGVKVISATAVNGGVKIDWLDQQGKRQQVVFEKVLIAAGRKPNLSSLDLNKAGVNVNDRGQPEWDPRTAQVVNSAIFMAGDVTNHNPLLHEAADEGRIAGMNSAQYPNVNAHVRRTPLSIAFTDPQIAMVGTHYKYLDLQSVEIGEVSFSNQGRSRVMGKNQGLLRVYATRQCCTILGAEVVGPRAEHLAHLLAVMVQERMSVHRALQLPFYHPVIEEGLRTALRDLANQLKITGDCRNQDFAMMPGN
ncbi:MAG: dihydrolipoamide dehydrogenase [Cryomorphaceae bacterium]|jgi:dihydrolipoamide dehydrogenase